MALRDRFALLFVWRVLPHALVLLQAATVAVGLRLVAEPDHSHAFGTLPRWLAVLGVGVLTTGYALQRHTAALELLALGTAAVVVAGFVGLGGSVKLPARLERLLSRGRGRSTTNLVLAGVALLVLFGAGPVLRMPIHSTLLLPKPKDEWALYDWMRTQTPRSALFLTPPDMEAFRLLSERAIVVNWKGVPAIPSELIDWLGRLRDVSGRPNLRTMEELAGYDSLDAERLERLRRRYGFDYVVVRRGHEAALAAYPTVYANARFVVLRAAKAPTTGPAS